MVSPLSVARPWAATLWAAPFSSSAAEAAVRSGKLVPLLRDFEPPAAPVSLVHAGRGMLPAKLRAFLDFSAPRLKARLEKIKI